MLFLSSLTQWSHTEIAFLSLPQGGMELFLAPSTPQVWKSTLNYSVILWESVKSGSCFQPCYVGGWCESSRSCYPHILVLILGAMIPAFLAWKKSILGQRLQGLVEVGCRQEFILFLSAGSNTNLDAKSILPLRAGLCVLGVWWGSLLESGPSSSDSNNKKKYEVLSLSESPWFWRQTRRIWVVRT